MSSHSGRVAAPTAFTDKMSTTCLASEVASSRVVKTMSWVMAVGSIPPSFVRPPG